MKYLSKIPVVGILRGASTDAVLGAVKAAYDGGLRVMEITLNRKEAFDQIQLLKKTFRSKLDFGAGTVLDVESAKKAIAAGAQFIVTPALVLDVIGFCRNKSVPVFPGAMTPTEILAAHRAGAEMVKVFPASCLGPGYIKSLKGPFPEIKLMPTGGVAPENVQEYFKAGASAIGVGGELFKKEWLAAGDWKAIKKAAQKYVAAIKGSWDQGPSHI
jgi:2-dehydro-3-deoxyphosphogluconate aldolase/(4S)-4-hydroxy-2-oxoglutarate aldolase